ncbi:MAG: serine hydroxymethyltransferase, partial [Nitrososphaerales archaeon]
MARSSFIDLVSKYEKYRSQTLNLIPSENILSPDVSTVLGSSMAGRYAGSPESYGGTKLFHEIWKKSEALAERVFSCKGASVVPISGHVAGMIALDQLCREGETIAVIPADYGGYKGYNQNYIPDVLGLKVVHLPFNQSKYNIDTDKAAEMIRQKKPSAVILGATVFLFPHPVKEISEAVHSYGGKVIYDGSHVLGLIAGKEFQRPLAEGADLMLGSTHKTLFGPQGGVILSDDESIMGRIEQSYLYR